MTLRAAPKKVINSITQQEQLNFLLTNRIPRRYATIVIGWLSKRENVIVRTILLTVWRIFSDLDLSEAKKRKFKSVHDCFTRELKEGARPVDMHEGSLVSPCDAIVGANGVVRDGMLLQAKGFPYSLKDLLDDPSLVEQYKNGTYVTLRLTSSMYHRFHAPHDCTVERVTYISGDTWNVNPIALRRIEKLFCKNGPAVIETQLRNGDLLTIVPVAAILVACIRLHCLKVPLNLAYRGPNVMPCAADYRKGDEMGWFEHGSTIVLLAPASWSFTENVETG